MPGEAVTRPAQATETLSFVLTTPGSQDFLLELDQGGLDWVVTLLPPRGEPQRFNSPLLRDEREWAVVHSEGPGTFTISLSSAEYTAATAAPSLRLTALPEDSAPQPNEVSVLRLLASAGQAVAAGGTDAWQRAITDYERASVLAQAAGLERLRAQALYSIATIAYWQLLEWDRAAELAAAAALLYAGTGETRLQGNALQLQAAALIEKANELEKSPSGGLAPEAREVFDAALALFDSAWRIQSAAGARYDAAKIVNNIGLTHYYMGEFNAAAERFGQAAALHRELRETDAELQSLSNLAVIDFEQGRLERAIASFDRSLELLPADRLPRQRADTLDNLAAARLGLGLFDEALRDFSAALVLHRSISDRKGEGRSLAGIGTTYAGIGETELALEYLEAALEVRQRANDGRGQVAVLRSLGILRRQEGDLDDALDAHQRAVRLATAPIDVARTQVLVAQDLTAAGRAAEALDLLADVASTAHDIGNDRLMADLRRSRGDALLVAGDLAAAATDYATAASAYQQLALGAERAQALHGLARAARGEARIEEALHHAEESITVIEGLRSQLVEPELRAHFLASRQAYYELLIDLLMQRAAGSETPQQWLNQALAVSERRRARALVDLVHEAAVLPADPGTPLLEREQVLYRRLAELRFRLNRLLDKPSTAGSDTANTIVAVTRQLADTENEINLLKLELRRQNPALADLTSPEILGVAVMQALLGADTALLHYALGENRSYLWLVTPAEVRSWTLPGRAAIEATARRAYDLLSRPSTAAAERQQLAATLEELAGQVLGGLDTLPAPRLIVVADGVLQYLPLGALRGSSRSGRAVPLLEEHEIAYVPSLSVLHALRSARRSSGAPQRQIALFADPVLDSSDPRLPGVVGSAEPAASGPGAPALSRLPATRHEVLGIAGLVPESDVFLALDFDASREAVFAAGLADYRLIHFATHGLVDSRYPALSALALSHFDAAGRPVDGFLRLHDLYNLRLDADLVVLSACSTALGRHIAGEGLTGLTQGLMYSGARSVLASLWQVPDRATAELMKRFYQNLLDGGQRPAEALRAAQVSLAAEPRWSSPYFWSAFVLQGEWL